MKRLFIFIGLLLSLTLSAQINVGVISAQKRTIAEASTLLNGLVSYWKLDEASGTLYDETDNNNDGTATNATLNQTGKIEKAVSFDGTGDYVSIAHSTSLNIANRISISAWVYLSGAVAHPILVKQYGGDGIPFYLETFYTTPRFSVYTDDWYRFASTQTISTGEWVHLVVTVDDVANEIVYYINGVAEDVISFTATIPQNTEAVRIGHYAINGECWNGLIDEVLVYNRVLIQSEVTELYNLTQPL